jgi:hypothetical protein
MHKKLHKRIQRMPRRIATDEGREWLRKAAGSCLLSFEPRISEWGNLRGVMPTCSYLNT